MRQTAIMITCVLMLVIGGICEQKYFKSSATYILSDINYIQNTIENGNYDLASEQIDNTIATWDSTKVIWGIFMGGGDLNNIDDYFQELKIYSRYKEDDEAMVAIEKIKSDLIKICENQQIRIENIL